MLESGGAVGVRLFAASAGGATPAAWPSGVDALLETDLAVDFSPGGNFIRSGMVGIVRTAANQGVRPRLKSR